MISGTYCAISAACCIKIATYFELILNVLAIMVNDGEGLYHVLYGIII